MSAPPAKPPAAAPPPLRAGSVPYLNAAPLTCGLADRLVFLPPAQLAQELRAGRLDAALLSVTEVLRSADYDVLDGVAVASDGPVFSVFLAHRGRLEDIREVACDPASLTSVNLLRVLLAERGLHPVLRELKDHAAAARHDAVLLIGNPAIAFRLAPHDHALWDLGAAWHAFTGLPFVYAAWALRRAADTAALRVELLAARDRGRRELPRLIAQPGEFDEATRRAYLTRHIRFDLGPAEKAGLARFAALLDLHGLGPARLPRFVC
ncbi:MAG: menaquinone biosynthesis protein [Limisphaerales bacterium]